MLRAIAFDLWETLITNTAELTREHTRLRLDAMARILREPPERIEQAYHGVWDRCQELYWSLDLDIPCRRQVEHFLELLDLDPASFEHIDELEHAYANIVVERPPECVDGAREALRDVRARGLRVGMISNTGRSPGYALREVLSWLGLASSIDAMVFSNEHGECKPRPSIFARLRDALGVDYDEILFVGDNLYADVHGAQQSGMRAVHFRPPVRGTAVAPPIDHGKDIVPDAAIDHLRDLGAAIDAITASASRR
jgi:putative hydrolase of the HAD superfamily